MENNNKNALEINQEQSKKISINTLSQYQIMCKIAEQEIRETCQNGSLKDLKLLRAEVISSKTNNKWDLKRIDDAIKERIYE